MDEYTSWIGPRSAPDAAVGEQQERRSLAGDEPVEVRSRLDTPLHVQRPEHVQIAIGVHAACEHELGAAHPDRLACLPDRGESARPPTVRGVAPLRVEAPARLLSQAFQ